MKEFLMSAILVMLFLIFMILIRTSDDINHIANNMFLEETVQEIEPISISIKELKEIGIGK